MAEVAQDEELAKRAAILDDLGLSVAKSRTEAIRGRESCGIENEWLEDEEFYEGVDDANRGEAAVWRTKPWGQAQVPSQRVQGSTVFLNITRPYCDAAAARVGDMLLPTDDRGWAIKPTPVPELDDIAKGEIPDHLDKEIRAGVEQEQQAMAAQGQEMPAEEMEGQVQSYRQELIDQAAEEVERAKRQAEKAETRIDDWHVECQYHAEMRTLIEDASQIGTGILKGPTPTMRKAVAWKENAMVIQEKIAPVSKRVSPWNCYPDFPACGENIHAGSFHWERDTITKKQLRELKAQPQYLKDQIDLCLQEGATKAKAEVDQSDHRRNLWGLSPKDGDTFEIWYGYVTLEREDLEAAGADVPTDDDGKAKFDDLAIPAQITLVNNHVIKAEPNLLDTGEFPYDYMVWSKRAGMPWGKGIARQIRTPQRMVNGAARNMMNNAGVAGGPMIVMKTGLVEPADGKYEIQPFKIWLVGEDEMIEDVRKAFTVVEIPMLQQELEAIILLALKMAEDVTGMPVLMQGQMGAAPDTVGGMKILNDNAGSPMRRIARLFDDRITEPHVRRYYAYLLQYGPDDEEKGDFQIDARGSSALVERDLNNMAIREMAQIVSDPTFGIDKKKWAKEMIMSQRLDYNRFKFDDEQWEQLLQQLMQQAQASDSAVEVANIRAQVEQMKTEVKAQLDQAKLQVASQDKAADRELQIALAAQQREKDERDAVLLQAVEALYAQTKMEELASGERKEVEKIKAGLAELVMKLKEQRYLAETNAKTTEIANPPTEPPGVAAPGQAYQA